MYDLLAGMRVVEASSFVASPSAGLYLAQMGAEVIRVDPIGGGPDFNRWPKADNGASFYWEGLNRGKKSVALNLGTAEGRALLQRLATASGDNGGLFVTNYPVDGFLAHERLAALRADLITVRIMGQANGGPALDYTVNAAIGVPFMTGPASLGDEPVNHVLPAWDLLTGAYAAFALLAAERHRRATGAGQEVRVPLADIGIASLANLGQVAEVLASGANRPRLGNEVFGALGRDFMTLDGERLMIMALTPRQWKGLVEALDMAAEVARIEAARGVSFAHDEGVRFEHRDVLLPLIAGRVATRTRSELAETFDRLGCCWGPYQTLRQAVDDPALVRGNPIFSEIENLSGLTYPVAGAPASLPDRDRRPPVAARRLGADSEEVLADLLGMGAGEIGRLVDAGTVGRPR